jgi:hypothetical protein
MGRKGAKRVLKEKPEGRRPVARNMHRREENIEMGLLEVGWGID